ncbi:hypothetical protein, partial [Komagataeibacter rhaeticus]|uniref:hypothetical protein n=1 Tax=Komagataeibacter rhaeticus TaxID=215221 RepID=UPI00241C1F6B
QLFPQQASQTGPPFSMKAIVNPFLRKGSFLAACPPSEGVTFPCRLTGNDSIVVIDCVFCNHQVGLGYLREETKSRTKLKTAAQVQTGLKIQTETERGNDLSFPR